MELEISNLHLISGNENKAKDHLNYSIKKSTTLEEYLHCIYLLYLTDQKPRARKLILDAKRRDFRPTGCMRQRQKLWENILLYNSKDFYKLFISSINKDDIWREDEYFTIFKEFLSKDQFQSAIEEKLKNSANFIHQMIANYKLWEISEEALKTYISKAAVLSKSEDNLLGLNKPLNEKELLNTLNKIYFSQDNLIDPEFKNLHYLLKALYHSRNGNSNQVNEALKKLKPIKSDSESEPLDLTKVYLNINKKKTGVSILSNLKKLHEHTPFEAHITHPEIAEFLLTKFPPTSQKKVLNRISLYKHLGNKSDAHKSIQKLLLMEKPYDSHELSDLVLRAAFPSEKMTVFFEQKYNDSPYHLKKLLILLDNRDRAKEIAVSLIDKCSNYDDISRLIIKLQELKLYEALPLAAEKSVRLAKKEEKAVLYSIVNAASIFNEVGDIKTAEAYMKEAEAKEMKNEYDRLEIAYIYATSLEKQTKVNELLKEINPENFDSPILLGMYAECLAAVNNKEKSLLYFDRAIKKTNNGLDAFRIKRLKEKYFK